VKSGSSFDALLFDVDGTLADTEELHRCAFNAAFRSHDLPWHWDAERYAHLLAVTGGKERLLAWIEQLDAPSIEKQRLAQMVPLIHASKTRHFVEYMTLQSVQLRTGIRRLIDEARAAGIALGIASTTSRENVDALLAAAFGRDFEGFDVIATGDAARRKKPAPDIYQIALDSLGIAADRAIAIEDSALGLQAAKAAGLFTVVTDNRWTSSQDFAAADLHVASLGDPEQPLDRVDEEKIGAPYLGLRQLMALHAAARP
jgi:HAD superfamily hydrolase (TIGR01509 family)